MVSVATIQPKVSIEGFPARQSDILEWQTYKYYQISGWCACESGRFPAPDLFEKNAEEGASHAKRERYAKWLEKLVNIGLSKKFMFSLVSMLWLRIDAHGSKESGDQQVYRDPTI